MKYFLVYQNRTYQHESMGEFLWAPQQAENGFKVHHWTRMKEIEPGDLIFSVVQQMVVSVNQALSSVVDAEKPAEMQTGNTWGQEGYLVKAEYHFLEEPFSVRENIQEILPLAQHKYSPFTSSGGGNQGYLYSITEELGDYLLRGIRENNDLSFLENNKVKPSAEEKKSVEKLARFLDEGVDQTTKEQLIQARIGQGAFRDSLFTRSTCCEICGIDFKPLLRASHIKPWSKSNDNERLDRDNGLLLCTEHDVLFDNGYITFQASRLTISNYVPYSIKERLAAFRDMDFQFTPEQQKYLAWHAQYLFKGGE